MFKEIRPALLSKTSPVLGGLMLWLCGAAMYGRMSVGIEYSLLMGSPRFLDNFLFFSVWLASSLVAARLIGTSHRHVMVFAISFLLTLMIWGLIELSYSLPPDTFERSLSLLLAPVSHFLLPILILAGVIVIRVHKQSQRKTNLSKPLLQGIKLQVYTLGFYFFMSTFLPSSITHERQLIIILVGFVLASLSYSCCVLNIIKNKKGLTHKSIAASLLIITAVIAASI